MAGQAVETMWEEYRDRGDVQFFALDTYDGSVTAVQSFIDATGATFPVLRRAKYLLEPCSTNPCQSTYGILYDNYVVIAPNGIVKYTSLNERFTGVGRFSSIHIRAAIDANLPTGVESHTWSAVKKLYE